jgi:excisionase family DNA binding protein
VASLEGELMSVDDVCKQLGKSKSAVYRTVRCHDIPFIHQDNRLYFDRATIKKWLEKKHNIECITRFEEFEKFMTPDP